MIPRLPVDTLWPHWRSAWILHEDADLLVVDKPAGLSTHAPEPDRSDDAWSRLRAFLQARGDEEAYLGIHQRLDRDTSGVLLFTRRREANPGIARQFEGRTVEKTYVAAIEGLRGRELPAVLRHRLVPGEDGAMRALPMEAPKGKAAAQRGARGERGPVGQEAITRCRVLERRGERALVELRPETGRTHQLRVQLAAEGLPIAGDTLYGGPAAPRLLLHAAALSLRHPTTGAPLSLRAALPAELHAWLERSAADPLADPARLGRTLAAAADRRYGLAHDEGLTAFRIVNGGGDGLPGVAVDVYGEHLVVSLSSEEAERAREGILDAVYRLGTSSPEEPARVRGVYVKVRPKHASVIVDPRRDEYAPREAVRGESAPEAFTILENGLPYEVRLGEGLSTGIFLDQRENRRRLQALAGGARVLNLFAYTGAFTVAAVAGGARSSVTVDVSRGAMEWARRNLDAVGADPAAHVVIDADVFPWLKAAAKAGEQFDLVLLDPPSFATTKKSRFSAESDYGLLAALAFAVVAPGGRLLACTNHRGISRATFRRRLRDGAREAGYALEQLKDLPDPVDFPPEPGAEPHLKSELALVARATAPASQARQKPRGRS
ncbi:MAG TPA: class I SAM-dependent methyltransferase [Candidatus Nanopelagicales bacterium]|nr:class I SAM-dependent methyltransferase [Candidatus Nanopelagicales bacterium]